MELYLNNKKNAIDLDIFSYHIQGLLGMYAYRSEITINMPSLVFIETVMSVELLKKRSEIEKLNVFKYQATINSPKIIIHRLN